MFPAMDLGAAAGWPAAGPDPAAGSPVAASMNSAETTWRFLPSIVTWNVAVASPGIGLPFLSTTCASTMTSSTPDLKGGWGVC